MPILQKSEQKLMKPLLLIKIKFILFLYSKLEQIKLMYLYEFRTLNKLLTMDVKHESCLNLQIFLTCELAG